MRIMNKTIMFFWGLIIFAICGYILFLGYNMKDKEYAAVTAQLKEASLAYAKDKNIELKFNESIKIFIDDLIDNEYIKDDELLDKYCIDSIVIQRGLIEDEYTFNIDCKKE